MPRFVFDFLLKVEGLTGKENKEGQNSNAGEYSPLDGSVDSRIDIDISTLIISSLPVGKNICSIFIISDTPDSEDSSLKFVRFSP
jgi:hypothetical protein